MVDLVRRLRRMEFWRSLRHYDFVSPSLVSLPVGFEKLFPTMEKGRSFNPLVPHTGRWDRRFPGVGWCTLEEATILYNYGLQFRDKEALEVGCWVGWSTIAVGLAGVHLTAVDPLLGGSPQAATLKTTLKRAGLADAVELAAGKSPAAIDALRETGCRWALVFIDGDHEGEAPVQDAQACAAGALEDAVIVLHDAVQENVCAALTWLMEHGWSCGIHYTAQLLAVAWRGAARPVLHRPDPAIEWESLVQRRWPHCAGFPRV